MAAKKKPVLVPGLPARETRSEEFVLLLMLLASARRLAGPVHCRDNLVGRMRRNLSRHAPSDVLAAQMFRYDLDVAAADARHTLATHCATCGSCELAFNEV